MCTRLSEPKRLPSASINIAAHLAGQRWYSLTPIGGEGRDEGAPRAQHKRSQNEQPPTCNAQPSLPRHSAAKAGPTESNRVQVSQTKSNQSLFSVSPVRVAGCGAEARFQLCGLDLPFRSQTKRAGHTVLPCSGAAKAGAPRRRHSAHRARNWPSTVLLQFGTPESTYR